MAVTGIFLQHYHPFRLAQLLGSSTLHGSRICSIRSRAREMETDIQECRSIGEVGGS